MTSIPEQAISAEGYSIGEALEKAATQLGVSRSRLAHSLDVEHFRNSAGGMVGSDTVKLFVWQVDEASVAGAEAAEAWLTSLLGHMGIESNVASRIVADKKAEVVLDSPSARYLVGRRGATVKAIREMVQEAMSGTFPDWSFRVEVMGGDRGEGGRERNDGRRERNDGYRDRDRDRDRGGRDGDRRGRRNSERDQDALKNLAGRLAEQVLDTGEAIKIRRDLNPFERRVVHLAIVEIDGVITETQDSDDGKKVWILRDEGGESTGDTGTEE